MAASSMASNLHLCDPPIFSSSINRLSPPVKGRGLSRQGIFEFCRSHVHGLSFCGIYGFILKKGEAGAKQFGMLAFALSGPASTDCRATPT